MIPDFLLSFTPFIRSFIHSPQEGGIIKPMIRHAPNARDNQREKNERGNADIDKLDKHTQTHRYTHGQADESDIYMMDMTL